MTISVQRPHDKLFKTVFSDTDEAESFLRAYLPETLTAQLDWSTLQLNETSFVDEAMQESESDLLYQVQHKETKEPILLYILFEHQSSPDKWMRFRLLKYMCRMWDETFRKQPTQDALPPILPLVFYQGETKWNYSTEFAELLPEIARTWSFVPRFAHLLVDQSGIDPEAVRGGLKAKIMQLLMLAAFHEPIQEALTLAAEFLAQVPRTGGINYELFFVVYLAATQKRQTVVEFVETLGDYTMGVRSAILTAAEEWKQEGELKGRVEGRVEGRMEAKIEVIENLLKIGMDWSLIEHATGINQDRFQELKRLFALMQLAQKPPTDLSPKQAPTN